MEELGVEELGVEELGVEELGVEKLTHPLTHSFKFISPAESAESAEDLRELERT